MAGGKKSKQKQKQKKGIPFLLLLPQLRLSRPQNNGLQAEHLALLLQLTMLNIMLKKHIQKYLWPWNYRIKDQQT